MDLAWSQVFIALVFCGNDHINSGKVGEWEEEILGVWSWYE
jgi:hypothetical protein